VNGVFEVSRSASSDSPTIVRIENGLGYIEKDWGFHFPQSWIWFQNNHFRTPNTSLFLSVAAVPWHSYSFPAFLVGFLHEGRLHRFCSYTGAKLRISSIDKDMVEIEASDSTANLHVRLQHSPSRMQLYGPRNGRMVKFVEESLGAVVSVRFQSSNGTLLFEENLVENSGLEVMGDIEWLQKNL
jgi:hypothetical protein